MSNTLINLIHDITLAEISSQVKDYPDLTNIITEINDKEQTVDSAVPAFFDCIGYSDIINYDSIDVADDIESLIKERTRNIVSSIIKCRNQSIFNLFDYFTGSKFHFTFDDIHLAVKKIRKQGTTSQIWMVTTPKTFNNLLVSNNLHKAITLKEQPEIYGIKPFIVDVAETSDIKCCLFASDAIGITWKNDTIHTEHKVNNFDVTIKEGIFCAGYKIILISKYIISILNKNYGVKLLA